MTKQAVGYLRCSTDKQDESVETQRREIEKYTRKNGYEIKKWFVDDGISGHDEDRPGFLQLLREAQSASWRFVIVRNQSRFSRVRPVTMASYLDQLDKSEVQLVTTDRGIIDPDDFIQFLISSIESNSDNEYSKTLSKLTIGGQVGRATSGHSCGQDAPYGLDRMYVDENGNHRQRVKNGEQFAKPKSWRVIFVPSDDEDEIATVRHIFAQYAEQRGGYTQIAADLNAKGIRSPRGGDWVAGTIRAMLKNSKYVGDFTWTRTRQGKFHAYQADEPRSRPKSEQARQKSGRRKQKVLVNDKADWIGKRDAFESIIDRKTFDKVQTLMDDRKKTDARPRRNEYVLSGLVYCHHCGGKMHGTTGKRKKGGKTYTYQNYVCSSYQKNRSCKSNKAHAEELTKAVIEQVLSMLRAPDNVERLRRAMDARAKVESTDNVERVAQLRSRREKLQKKIDRGTKRVFEAPDDMIDALYVELGKLKRQLEAVQEELAQIGDLKSQPPKWTADDVIELLGQLADELEQCPPERLKEMLAKLILRVEVKFETVEQGKRKKQRLCGGIVYFAESLVLGMAGTGFEPATSRL